MKVEAYKRGFYGGVLREPGHRFARFILTDPKHFSDKWMRKLKAGADVQATPMKAPQSDPTKSFIDLMNDPTPEMKTGKAHRESAQSQVQDTKNKETGKSTGDQDVI